MAQTDFSPNLKETGSFQSVFLSSLTNVVHLPHLLSKNEQRRSCPDGTFNGNDVQNGTGNVSELIELGYPVSSSSVVEPAGVLASSPASSELIEPGFSASSSSSHVVGLQGHPFGVEPAGSSSSVAAPHLTT